MIRAAALLLSVATGFSGLVYQVSWQRYLATLLGSHAEATASVLGLFLGGLSLGYALFGAVTRRHLARAEARGARPHLLRLYGAVEAAIGVWALAFPLLFGGAQWLALRLPVVGGGLGLIFDVALSALLIGPPTILMGGTIPILTQALARGMQEATRVHALVYAFNTAGAFAGALAAGFWLVAWLGLDGTLAAMAAVNLAAGGFFALLDRRSPVAAAPPTESQAARVPGLAIYAAVALLSGFAMMALEVVLIRLGGLALGSSEYSFSLVVAAFVLCIAIGSLAVSFFERIPRALLLANQLLLVALLLVLYRLVPDVPYAAHVLRTVFVSHEAAFYPFYALAFLGVLTLIGLPVALSGATLPLLFDHLRRRHGELGAVAGRLYSWNTAGSLCGALIGGYALLFWVDLHHVYRIAVGALTVGAALLAAQLRGVGAAIGGVAAAAAALLLVAFEPWAPEYIASGLFRGRQELPHTYQGADAFMDWLWTDRRILFYEDDPTTSVGVVEQSFPDGNVRLLTVNGKPDGATTLDILTAGLLGLLPALFADTPHRAFVVGYGAGVTAGELAQLDTIEEVVVAEISSAVVRAAPFFDATSGGASHHPKVRVVRSDAYRALMRSEERFDVIASEPSNPWVTGVEMLYSREFLEAARRHLAPGGVYCQWINQYETDAAVVLLVLRTYASVFDHISVWYGLANDLLLMGFDDGDTALHLERLAARVERPDYAAGLERIGLNGLPELLAHELLPLGVVDAMDFEGPLHTLHHPRLNHMAARAFFPGETGQLPFTGFGAAARVGGRNALVRRYLASLAEEAQDEARARIVGESCRHRERQCTTLLAEWFDRDSESQRLRDRLAALRGQGPIFEGRVNPRTSVLIARWFFGSEEGESAKDVSVREAEQATGVFLHYYQHAAPFAAERLLGLWQRCRSDTSACEEGQERVRALLAGSQRLSRVPGGRY